MNLKGLQTFREKLPRLQGAKIYRLLLLFLGALILGLVVISISFLLPRLYPTIYILVALEPVIPIFAIFFCVVMGFLSIFSVRIKKEKLKSKYKKLAYQKALQYGLFGIPFAISVIVYSYLPINTLYLIPAVNPITNFFSDSLISLIPIVSYYDLLIRLIGGTIFIVLGVITAAQALFTFGIDYMALVYLYYPEESEVQQHKIYSILRHPAYTAVFMINIGSFIIRFSIYSLISTCLFHTFILILIHFVEEKELIQRFGDSYLEYKKQVPALFLNPKKIRTFFRFLIGRNT
ncbi:MAG: methyltransferase family protein [Promethearchaeota archaeon]